MQAVILAGGVGRRLWPISTENNPKPFIRLNDNQSLLQKTLIRANEIKADNIIIVTGSNFIAKAIADSNEIDRNLWFNNLSFILEPSSKDTAAAITAAALHISNIFGDNELMIVLPSDQIISDHDIFLEAVYKASNLAKQGKIVAFGIKPTYPEVNYGYIEFEGNNVINFIEKPKKDLAIKYLESGNFLWNLGIFCFSVGTFLNGMKKFSSDTLNLVKQSLLLSSYKNLSNYQAIFLEESSWNLIKNNSIDYVLMEKLKQLSVVECNMSWRDIGNWDAISKEFGHDINGNNIKGETVLHDVSDCYIESNGKLIAAVGVNNLAIIQTEDGFLVVNKNRASDVKEIFHTLKEKTIVN